MAAPAPIPTSSIANGNLQAVSDCLPPASTILQIAVEYWRARAPFDAAFATWR